MKDINCASVIIEKRREKGITQEELAAYLGVTKASVSKWETGASYPDIAFLPILAAYFDISIDCLMGYSPQMADGDIAKLHGRLASDFTKKPFEEVMAECGGIVKKYYSCYALLNKIALLYLNHAQLAGDAERTQEIIKEAIKLCQRIISNSKDPGMVGGTANIQAYCHIALNDGRAVLALLGESLTDSSPDGTLIAQAYKLLGNEEKYQETIQADLYQKLMAILQAMILALQNNLGDLAKAEPIYQRAEIIADAFNMKRLNVNNIAGLYFLGAQMYQLGGMPEKAIELLDKFADVCINDFFPFALRGDGFFDKLDDFIAQSVGLMPRNETAVKNDMAQYLSDPVFEPLRENASFKRIAKKLNDFVGKEVN